MTIKNVDEFVDKVGKGMLKTNPATPAPNAPAPAPNPQGAPPVVDNKQKPAEAAPGKKPDEKPSEPDFTSVEIPGVLLGEKPAEKKPAAPPHEPAHVEPEPPEAVSWDRKTRQTFASMRAQLSATQDELQKLKTAAPKPPQGEQQSTEAVVQEITQHKAEIEGLKQKLSEAYDQLGRFSLEADPRFQAKYSNQQKAIVDQIKDIAKEWEIKEDTLDDILKAGTKRRIELINEIAPDLTPILTARLADYDHIEKMKQMELSRHKEVSAQLVEQQQQEFAHKDQQGRVTMLRGAAEKVLKDGHVVFQKVDGQEAWNKVVDSLHNRAKYLFSANDAPAQSESMLLGIAAPIYLSWFKKEREARIALEKQLKDRYGVKPGLESKPTDDSRQRIPASGESAGAAVDAVMQEFKVS